MIFETPSNPCLEIIDIENVVKLAKVKKVLVAVDNVFATPILQKTFKIWCRCCYVFSHKAHRWSWTCFRRATFGKRKILSRIHQNLYRNTGPSISPFNAWILIKGLDTLELRINKQTENTKIIINYLEQSKFIEKIYYPHLASSSQFNLAKKQMSGGGNIVSFKIASKKNKGKCNASLLK